MELYAAKTPEIGPFAGRRLSKFDQVVNVVEDKV